MGTKIYISIINAFERIRPEWLVVTNDDFSNVQLEEAPPIEAINKSGNTVTVRPSILADGSISLSRRGFDCWYKVPEFAEHNYHQPAFGYKEALKVYLDRIMVDVKKAVRASIKSTEALSEDAMKPTTEIDDKGNKIWKLWYNSTIGK